MFSESERDLLKISRALINLHGFFIVDAEYNIIDSPIIIADLLTKVELESFKAIASLTPEERFNVEESVVKNCSLAILGSDSQLVPGLCPAGVISFIANAIITKSEQYLVNQGNSAYLESASNVNYLETMCAIISYYMNISYDYAISLPITEIYKRYAVCQQAFPNQVQPIEVE